MGLGSKHPVCFVFNTRALVPWEIVEKGMREGDIQDAMINWQEAHMPGHYFSENDPVADVDNPEQKMRVKRIVREKVPSVQTGDAKKSGRIIGIECYWWMEITIDEVLKMINKISNRKAVPGVYVDESITIKSNES